MSFSVPLFGFEELRRPARWSLGLHVALIILGMIGLPNLAKKPLVQPQNIVVDLVTPSELTAAPNTTKQEPVQKPEPTPPAEPDKPKPAPKSEPPKNMDTPQVKKPDVVKKEAAKPEPVPTKKPAEKVEKKKEEKKEEPEEVTAAQQEEFSSFLKNLVGEESTPSQPKTANAPVDATKDTGIAPVISETLSMSQADALRYQLASCWNVPVGAIDAENLVVEILTTVGPDRVVKTTEIVDKSRYNSDPFFRTAAESARRALLNPRCSPLSLPEDKYEVWKTMRIRFNPTEMFGG